MLALFYVYSFVFYFVLQHFFDWLCEACECSMISTICQAFVGLSVLPRKPSSHACRVACYSRHPLCFGSSPDERDCFPPVGVSTGILSGTSSVTSLPAPSCSVRNLKLLFLTSCFRSSVWCRRDCCGRSRGDPSYLCPFRLGSRLCQNW